MGLLTIFEKINKKIKNKKNWPPLINKIEPIKNKIHPLQNFCPLNVEKKILQEMLFSQYFRNIFVTNPK